MIGDSTRWKCFDAGISARNARMTSACTHQFDPARERRLVEPPRQQERHHQRGDEQADDDRFDRDVVPSADRAERTRAGSAGTRCRRARRRQTASGPSGRPRTSRCRSDRRCRGRAGTRRPCSRRRRRSPRTRARARGRPAAARRSSCAGRRRRPGTARRGRRGGRVEKVLGAAAISRTRVATCAANAPTKTTTSSQRTQCLHQADYIGRPASQLTSWISR